MHLSSTKLFFTFLLLGFCIAGEAQIKFTATVSPENPGRDEYITLRYTAENVHAIESIQLPSLNEFHIVTGPARESGMSSMNGRTKEYMAMSYVLKPKHSGRIYIASAIATIAGKAYKSNPLTLAVSKNASGRAVQQASAFRGFDAWEEPAPQDFRNDVIGSRESAQAKIKNNMLLRLVTNKQSVYEGEPILAEYRLYTRLKSESSLTKNPSFNGFSVVEVPPEHHTNGDREKYNGTEYNVYTIRKAQLYPLQAGPALLDAATLDNRVQLIRVPEGSRSFDDAEVIVENASLSSKPINIVVKPLPAGKPASFTGGVGRFDFTCTPVKTGITTDDIGKLLLTVNGKGNMHLITAPQVKWPAGFEVFEPKVIDNSVTAVCPLSGNKVFELTFAAAAPGDYRIPPVEFSFFDPSDGRYHTVKSKPLVINVSAGKVSRMQAGGVADDPTKEKGKGTVILVAGATGLLLLMAFLFFRKKPEAERSVAPKPEEIQGVTLAAAASHHNPLSKTEECLQHEDCPEFYRVLNEELRNFFSEKFGMTPEMVNPKSIGNAMDNAGIDNSTTLEAQQLIRDVEWQLYTPFEKTQKLSELYATACAVIQLVNMPRA